MTYQGFFNIIDYPLTHNILLLRTYKLEAGQPVNTDLSLDSVYYLELPAYFHNLEVELGNQADCQYILDRCNPEFVPTVAPGDVFVLKTNDKRYFVGARRLRVSTNTLAVGETSIGFKRIL